MSERRFWSKAFLMFGGLLIWAAHFMFVYSANAVACARGFTHITVLGVGLVPFTLILATLLALLATGYLLYTALSWSGPLRGEANDDPASAFLRQITIVLTLIAMIAIVWNALPASIVTPCT